MNRSIEPKQLFIGDYLKLNKKETFIVPKYQRSYSWDKSKCEKLWDDIDIFRKSNQDEPYFFGTIITDRSESHANEIYIIDGQQRTTTFLLLAKALQLKILETLKQFTTNDETERLKRGLETVLDSILGIFLKMEDIGEVVDLRKNWTIINNVTLVKNESMNEQFFTDFWEIIKSQNYVEAENKVIKITRKKKDNKYSNFFRNFKFFYEEKVRNLEQSEIYDFANKFLNKCQIIEIRSWDNEQAIQMFNSLNSTGQPLSDADIISAQLYSKAKEDEDSFKTKWKELLKETSDLESRGIATTYAVLQQFMYIDRARDNQHDVDILAVRKYYLDIKKDYLENPLFLCNEFLKITKRWQKVKKITAVRILLKLNENAKLFLSSYLSRFEPDEIECNISSIVGVAESLIRLFTILEITDSVYSSKRFKIFLFEENIKLANKGISESEINYDIGTHIKNNWDSSSIEKNILDYQDNSLVFLNEYLFAKEEHLPFELEDSVNIEHIMPSSGEHKRSIQEMAGIKDDEEFRNLVNKLGNKILLEEKINKNLHDTWFRQKKTKSIKEKEGYKNSKYPIALSLTNYPNDYWEKEDINKNTEKIAKRISKFVFADN